MTTKGRRKAPRSLTGLKLRLPGWTSGVSPFGALYPRDEDKVEFAVRLSRWNVRHGTGGPFGAAVFEDPSGRLISLGVNAVLENRCSLAHAEMQSLALAQRKLQRHRLNGRPGKSYVLASSAQPCAMCFGAVLWAGLAHDYVLSSGKAQWGNSSLLSLCPK